MMDLWSLTVQGLDHSSYQRLVAVIPFQFVFIRKVGCSCRETHQPFELSPAPLLYVPHVCPTPAAAVCNPKGSFTAESVLPCMSSA